MLVWGLGGDHNDFLMLLCIMLGFYLLLLARARAATTAVRLAGDGRVGAAGARALAAPAQENAGIAADAAGAVGRTRPAFARRFAELLVPLSRSSSPPARRS